MAGAGTLLARRRAVRRPLANALDLDVRGGLTDQVTPHAGSAFLLERSRQSGTIAAAERYLRTKLSRKGLRQGELVEAFVLLSALGGECLDDFQGLRRDRGLAALPATTSRPPRPPGKGWSAGSTTPRRSRTVRPSQGSFIPRESTGLAGLRAVTERPRAAGC